MYKVTINEESNILEFNEAFNKLEEHLTYLGNSKEQADYYTRGLFTALVSVEFSNGGFKINCAENTSKYGFAIENWNPNKDNLI